MKANLVQLGCLFWIAVVILLSAGVGLLVNNGLSNSDQIPFLANLVLSSVSGFVALFVLGGISILIIFATDNDPDHAGTV